MGPFKWIGEIEARVGDCIRRSLKPGAIASFLGGTTVATLKDDPEILTLGDLVRIVQNPDSWEKLGFPLDRQEFSKILDEVREYRNRLMHFRDPLSSDEKHSLQNCCEMVRDNC